MKFISLCLLAILALYSCKKEGPGGTASLQFTVKHHDELIPGAQVYIKYGAKESPGTVTGSYDGVVIANSAAQGSYLDLVQGDYYLFGVGYDTALSATVSGGLPVHLKKGEFKTLTVAVTE